MCLLIIYYRIYLFICYVSVNIFFIWLTVYVLKVIVVELFLAFAEEFWDIKRRIPEIFLRLNLHEVIFSSSLTVLPFAS